MKKIISVLLLVCCINSVNAQVKRLDGPRFGLTVLTQGLLADIVNDNRELDSDDPVNYSQKQAIITQFGWQWETRLVEGGDYPCIDASCQVNVEIFIIGHHGNKRPR